MKLATLRIIPHRNTANNETKRLYSALYDLFIPEKENPILAQAKRLTGKSKEPAYLWWIVRMAASAEGEREQEKTVKKIEYFVMMPETYIDAYKTKIKGFKGWKSSTLEPVDQFEPVQDMKQTNLYRLKLKRHDMFSLEHNFAEQETPIREAMSVIHEMKAGESLTLFMRMEPVDRVKWKRTADYAWEQWQKGDILYRAGFDPLRIAGKVYELGDNLFNRSQNFVSDVLGAVKRQVSPPGETDFQHKEAPKKVNHERELLLVNGDLSPRTKGKRNSPVFKTVIRFTVTSSDKVRREMLARSFTSAFESPDKQSKWKDNILEAKKFSKKELVALKNWEIKDMDPNILSVDEIGKLQQLPTAQLQEEFKEMLQANQRIEIEIPKVFLDDTGILCGTATDRGTTHNIYIPTTSKDFLFTPRVFNGSPRMGKDQAVINLIVEAKRKHGIGSLIPEFIDERNRTPDGKHWRGMANGVRDALNPEDVMDFDMSNTLYSLYLGLQSAFQNLSDPRIQGDVIAEYLSDFLLSEGDGDKFQTQEYVREAAKITAGDLIGMKQMFIDQKYRQTKIKQYADIFDTFVWEDYDKMTDPKSGQMSSAQATKAAPILRRIGQIEGREYLKPMFCQTLNPEFKLAKWIEEGKVIIFRCRMPKGIAMPEPVKQILGYWIMLITFIIKLSLDGRGAGTLMVFNEPHQYISKGLIHFMERMLSEGPKYRFTPVIAFHNFSQFKNHRSFVDMLKSSNPNWHLFKNSNQDVYKELMPILSKTFETEQQAFEATKEFQYIACFMNGGEYEPPFVCDALPMVNDRYQEQDNSKLTEEHIKLYGRPTEEVLREIKERRRMVAK